MSHSKVQSNLISRSFYFWNISLYEPRLMYISYCHVRDGIYIYFLNQKDTFLHEDHIINKIFMKLSIRDSQGSLALRLSIQAT